jgi:Spy/CpxP family protein refolding chaperone
MKMKTVLGFTAALAAIAVVMAMATGPAAAAGPAGQRGQMSRPPAGPPPGPRGGGGPGGIGRMLFELNLTAAQLEQVKSLTEAEREAATPYHETLRDLDEQMRAAVESGAFDEAAARAIAVKEAAATAELRVIGARTQSAIFGLLTDEQKKAMAEARDGQRPPREHRGR